MVSYVSKQVSYSIALLKCFFFVYMKHPNEQQNINQQSKQFHSDKLGNLIFYKSRQVKRKTHHQTPPGIEIKFNCIYSKIKNQTPLKPKGIIHFIQHHPMKEEFQNSRRNGRQTMEMMEIQMMIVMMMMMLLMMLLKLMIQPLEKITQTFSLTYVNYLHKTIPN